MKYLVNTFYILLKALDCILSFFKKKNFLNHLFDFLYSKNTTIIQIEKKKIRFWTPSNYSKYSVENFLSKEKLVEKFISDIPDNENNIFWDIGSNLGLYSIYCASKKEKVKIVSIECSPSAVLAISKNISLNNLHDRINIFPIGLTNIANNFLLLRENRDSLGDQFNSLGEELNLKNKKKKEANKYKIYSNTVNNILENQVLEIPSHIKLDVDGFELEVLEGFDKFLNNKKIESIIIEMKYGSRIIDGYELDEESLEKRSDRIYDILIKSGFTSKHLSNGNQKKGWYLDCFFKSGSKKIVD